MMYEREIEVMYASICSRKNVNVCTEKKECNYSHRKYTIVFLLKVKRTRLQKMRSQCLFEIVFTEMFESVLKKTVHVRRHTTIMYLCYPI